MVRKLVVRVYGILINEKEEVLLSDEIIKGFKTTKFPGGGLELGEGVLECLVRELKEECAIDLVSASHFHTTENFITSKWDEECQVICMYYLCQSQQLHTIPTSNKKFDLIEKAGIDAESFRWVDIYALDEETDVNLPADKTVIDLLIEKYPKVGFKMPGLNR